MDLLTGLVVDETQTVTLAELCRCCSLPAEEVMVMVEYGIVEPLETRVTHSRWQFSGSSVVRIQRAMRLQRDLGVNLAGAALALELLDEVRASRQQLAGRRKWE
ncbi:MerR family transcriptional regulator [Thiothrix nivea DSM 5205]|uniref:MerR family transcriptional regulator n=2 Tax=Thiothrix nivea TaxID=1031 RepID=A0A656HEW4_THINJ|nr:MerR family transcriptional regulator [Thiothrix nivea DSM 5205]